MPLVVVAITIPKIVLQTEELVGVVDNYLHCPVTPGTTTNLTITPWVNGMVTGSDLITGGTATDNYRSFQGESMIRTGLD